MKFTSEYLQDIGFRGVRSSDVAPLDEFERMRFMTGLYGGNFIIFGLVRKEAKWDIESVTTIGRDAFLLVSSRILKYEIEEVVSFVIESPIGTDWPRAIASRLHHDETSVKKMFLLGFSSESPLNSPLSEEKSDILEAKSVCFLKKFSEDETLSLTLKVCHGFWEISELTTRGESTYFLTRNAIKDYSAEEVLNLVEKL